MRWVLFVCESFRRMVNFFVLVQGKQWEKKFQSSFNPRHPPPPAVSDLGLSLTNVMRHLLHDPSILKLHPLETVYEVMEDDSFEER